MGSMPLTRIWGWISEYNTWVQSQLHGHTVCAATQSPALGRDPFLFRCSAIVLKFFMTLTCIHKRQRSMHNNREKHIQYECLPLLLPHSLTGLKMTQKAQDSYIEIHCIYKFKQDSNQVQGMTSPSWNQFKSRASHTMGRGGLGGTTSPTSTLAVGLTARLRAVPTYQNTGRVYSQAFQPAAWGVSLTKQCTRCSQPYPPTCSKQLQLRHNRTVHSTYTPEVPSLGVPGVMNFWALQDTYI